MYENITSGKIIDIEYVMMQTGETMKNPKESGIKITRINSSNKIHFYPLMRTEAYLSVDEPFHYTIGAIKENAEDDDNRCRFC